MSPTGAPFVHWGKVRPLARHTPCGPLSWTGHDESTPIYGHPGDRSLHPERILLFCVACDTEWKRAGILVVIDRDYPDQIDVEVVHKALMIGDAGGAHVAKLARQLGVGPGFGELDAALLLDRRSRDAG
jgi:hypothetical protein